MGIVRATYSTTSPIAPYGVNDRFELVYDMEDGEDQKEARKKLVKEVRQWAKESDVNNTVHTQVGVYEPSISGMVPEINRNDEKIEIAIDNAQTIEELNALNKNLPVTLLSHFTKRLTELKKQ